MTKQKIQLPTKDAILQSMRVAETSVEAAEYLGERFKKILTKAKMLDTYADILQKVEEFVKYVRFMLLSSNQPWSGQRFDSTDFKNLQSNVANEAAEQLKAMNVGIENTIKIDFAINSQGDFLRGYSVGGNAPDSKAVDAIDKLFAAWLSENNIVCKDSVLYKADENGQISRENGKDVRISPEEMQKIYSDPQKGLANYLSSKGFKAEAQQQNYPTAEQQAQAQKALQASIQAIPEPTPAADSGMKAGM